jgi:hypothetical protein
VSRLDVREETDNGVEVGVYPALFAISRASFFTASSG